MVVGTKIMNGHIDSRSIAVSSYAPMQQQHLQTENSGSDINSALTVSISQKIQIWYYYGCIMTES
jgi:hypothetical protein